MNTKYTYQRNELFEHDNKNLRLNARIDNFEMEFIEKEMKELKIDNKSKFIRFLIRFYIVNKK